MAVFELLFIGARLWVMAWTLVAQSVLWFRGPPRGVANAGGMVPDGDGRDAG